MRYLFGFSMIVLLLVGSAAAQAKRNTRPSAASTPIPEATPTPDRAKKNERPTANRPTTTDVEPTSKGPQYRYEFTQPDFVVSHIVLVHDDAGRGTISFRKSSLGEDLTEKIVVSRASLDKLRAAFDALNFLDSTENYQYERDFSNMGNIAITYSKDGRERTAKYNWTSNANAKMLMDEYRRLANQFVWMFDFNLARENQPLETPRLVDSLDSLINRNEISDPQQMLPFLTAISNDERVPLIGRNRANKIVQKIEKRKK
ncbi:MAG TPA: hypothetical protein PLK77_06745 [Pyrinomonadaceae bacterium]|nr:hypothetical protein [Pyrinomonadaceae bacterium]